MSIYMYICVCMCVGTDTCQGKVNWTSLITECQKSDDVGNIETYTVFMFKVFMGIFSVISRIKKKKKK